VGEQAEAGVELRAVDKDLERLWHERRTALIGTIAAISGDRDAAIDAVDEAFARAFQRRTRVEAMASPTGWILTVARNELRRGKRRGARRRRAETSSADGRAAWIEPADPRIELWAAVQSLPERERTAIALRYLADLTEPQIARTMGVAVGTVGASLTSARQKLARRLQEPGDERPQHDQERGRR
jgi:RNA polymerase sigma factor (sigma-70 family)